MKNFIKQNWFKIGILIILGGAVFAFIQTNRNATPAVSVVPSESSTSTVEVQNPPIQAAPVVNAASDISSTVPAKKIITTPPTQPSWHTAFTYSGESTTDSAPFRMHGSQWRITYTCAGTGQYPGVLVTITGADSQTLGQSESFGSSVDDCPPSHVYNFYNHTLGLYTFDASDSNASYTINIEDYY